MGRTGVYLAQNWSDHREIRIIRIQINKGLLHSRNIHN